MYETQFPTLLYYTSLFFISFHFFTFIVYWMVRFINPGMAELLSIYAQRYVFKHLSYEGSFLPFLFIGLGLMLLAAFLGS